MEEYTSKVYILLDEQNHITRCEGGYSLSNIQNIDEWTFIDEGVGDKYNHCQGGYFENGLTTQDGCHRYIYENGECRLATESELQAELSSFPLPLPTPQEDTDAMLVDLELRLSLLEMGV